MSYAKTQILFNNKSLNNYRLIGTTTQFTKIIKALSQYSFAIPYLLNSFTRYQLIGSNGRILNFIINLNGELAQADLPLKIDTITNGVMLEFFGFVGLGTDQLERNLIIINP
jgi:hypothetical protein